MSFDFPVLGNFYQCLLLLLPFAAKTFNYEDPNNWYLEYPGCLGYQQSPIGIYAKRVVPIFLPPLIFGHYDVQIAEFLKLHNNGHTVEFKVPLTVLGTKPFLTGGLLTDIYEAETVHFHWGSPVQKGAEHLLNGRRYDLEMHIVHKNIKYADIAIAQEFPDGIAVLAILFKTVRKSPLYTPGLSEIYQSLNYIVDFNATYSPTKYITLGSLLSRIDRNNFYTYKGSLTTPPCSEAVIWQIFPQVLPIFHLELMKFWHIKTEKGERLLNNFRPMQNSNYRKVYHRQSTTEINQFFSELI